MLWFFHILDYLLWAFLALSVFYVVFFAIASLFPRRKNRVPSAPESALTDFLVFLPAYHEDNVIRQSVEALLCQDYPQSHYQVMVISDHMQPATNQWLSQQPITLLQPIFDNSSKAKALQFAMRQVDSQRERVVILDADNLVAPDFLSRLNTVCQQGYQAIQCHRTAKNSDNDVAALDGLSEEINNTLFRRAHNNIGLSSALIGSGMCFTYEWFVRHIDRLSTAVEDRELEALLLFERFHIHYAADIHVKDEKVASSDNFQRQRLRWMTGQVQSLFAMLPNIPKAISTGNIDYIDKTLQQALIPRSILLLLLPVISLMITVLHWPWSLKWWLLLVLFGLSLLIAIPSPLRSKALSRSVFALPSLAWRMLKNLSRIKKSDTTFHHTEHISS